jgi:hypothetical protein
VPALLKCLALSCYQLCAGERFGGLAPVALERSIGGLLGHACAVSLSRPARARRCTAWSTSSPAAGAQTFSIPAPAWVKFLQLRFLTHYGGEPVCALNELSVFGKSAVEDLEVRCAARLLKPGAVARAWLRAGPLSAEAGCARGARCLTPDRPARSQDCPVLDDRGDGGAGLWCRRRRGARAACGCSAGSRLARRHIALVLCALL